MRAIIILICVLLTNSVLNAQLDKGQWIVGGNGSFDQFKQKSTIPGFPANSKTTSIRATEGFGYFFADRFAGGLRFVQNFQKYHSDLNGRETPPFYLYAENDEKTTGIGVSPFVRYYLLPSSNKVNILAEANFTYLSTKSVTQSMQIQGDPNDAIPDQAMQSKSTIKNKLNNWGIVAGPAFFLNPKVSLELTVGYTFGKDSESDVKSHSIVGGIGFQIHLGKYTAKK